MNPGDVVQRAERAKQLMGDAVMQSAFDAVTAAYVTEMRKCAPSDDDGRYRYAQALNIIEGVKLHLTELIARGQLTERQSQEFRTPTPLERVKRIF